MKLAVTIGVVSLVAILSLLFTYWVMTLTHDPQKRVYYALAMVAGINVIAFASRKWWR